MGLFQDMFNFMYKKVGVQIEIMLSIHNMFLENERVRRWEEKQEKLARKEEEMKNYSPYVMLLTNEIENVKKAYKPLPSITYRAAKEDEEISNEESTYKVFSEMEAESKLKRYKTEDNLMLNPYTETHSQVNDSDLAAFHWIRANAD